MTTTGRAIANPLQALLAQAATTPRDTGESARAKQRSRPHGAQVILCDVSSSMADPAGGGKARIDHLRDALHQVAEPGHILIAFSSSVTMMQTVEELPEPSGGTSLELGLAAAARHSPRATLVISDGEPTVPEAALRAAARLPGRIDVIFCGDDHRHDAVEFMRELARVGAGAVVVHRWGEQLERPIAGTMRLLLAGPGR